MRLAIQGTEAGAEVVGSSAYYTMGGHLYQYLISGSPSKAGDANAQGRERDLILPESRPDYRHRPGC